MYLSLILIELFFKPEVIQKEIDGEIQEPYEQIIIDIEEIHQGSIMEELGIILLKT